MIYIILLILALISIIYLSKRIKNRSQLIFIMLAIIVLFLVATGRAHWISALFVALIPIFKKLFLIIRYLPILQRFASGYNNAKKRARKSDGMSKAEAAEILGINENSNKEEIISAHKKEMQKHHPDKGGSKEMAAKINAARDTLLG